MHSSIRAGMFYPIVLIQAIKIGRHWSRVGRMSVVKVAFRQKCRLSIEDR